MNDAETVRILQSAVPDVIAVYRFGSTVSGDAHAGSDIDIAVLAARPLDPVFRFEVQEQLAVANRCDVDLVDLRSASTVMQMQVISRGITLAVLDHAAQAHFETYVYSAYARLNEERKAIVQQVLREGTVHAR
jgi:predicted nucleotidyltransferase